MLICNKVNKNFSDGSSKLCILNDVNLSVDLGETVVIVGASGCGKSTLLHVISGLEKASSGEIFFDGMLIDNLSENELCNIRLNKIGFVYQFHHLIKELSVKENISLPLLINKVDSHEIENKVNNIIDQIGLKNRSKHQIDQLSGGERQRVAIARSIIHNPKIIFADEPTGNLDKTNAKNILSLLNDLVNYNNSSLVMVTHDMDIASKFKRRLSIQNGSLFGI